MARTYRFTPLRRLVNLLVFPLIRLGISDRRLHLLTVRGRDGRPYTVPVTLIEHEGRRWLVAPYGEVLWVRRARAAGEVTLSRARRSRTVPLEQASPEEAARVLREYLRQVPVVRPYFDVTSASSLEEIAAEAPRHPVFRIPSSGSEGP